MRRIYIPCAFYTYTSCFKSYREEMLLLDSLVRLGTYWGQTGDRQGQTGDRLGTSATYSELKSAASVFCFSPCHFPTYVTHFPVSNLL